MRSQTGWGVALGVALGGFFDGILLHQILQWHHLFSLVPGMTDLRTQVLWDGYFHALMYVVAAVALWGLWRERRRRAQAPSPPLLPALLIGFGLWHVLDAVLSHWLLGIHRIRVDSDNPLLWDLLWLSVFGLAPLAGGAWLLRGGRAGMTPSALVLVLLTFGTAGAGGWTLMPPRDQPYTTVVFRPGLTRPQAWAALARADARLVWSDPGMGVVVAEIAPDRRWRLYRHGAVLVSGSGVPAGCAGWSRT